jgi:hypothetical protein
LFLDRLDGVAWSNPPYPASASPKRSGFDSVRFDERVERTALGVDVTVRSEHLVFDETIV